MKRLTPWSICILLVVVTLATAHCRGASQSWQSDWKEFTAEYPKTQGKVTQTKQFVGKDVIWKGKVKNVMPPDKGKNTGIVVLEMNPQLRLGDYSTDTVSLSPLQEEWSAWDQMQNGQEVIFQTRLTGIFGDDGEAPVMIVNMTDGRKFAQLFTKGGKLSQVIRDAKSEK